MTTAATTTTNNNDNDNNDDNNNHNDKTSSNVQTCRAEAGAAPSGYAHFRTGIGNNMVSVIAWGVHTRRPPVVLLRLVITSTANIYTYTPII